MHLGEAADVVLEGPDRTALFGHQHFDQTHHGLRHAVDELGRKSVVEPPRATNDVLTAHGEQHFGAVTHQFVAQRPQDRFLVRPPVELPDHPVHGQARHTEPVAATNHPFEWLPAVRRREERFEVGDVPVRDVHHRPNHRHGLQVVDEVPQTPQSQAPTGSYGPLTEDLRHRLFRHLHLHVDQAQHERALLEHMREPDFDMVADLVQLGQTRVAIACSVRKDHTHGFDAANDGLRNADGSRQVSVRRHIARVVGAGQPVRERGHGPHGRGTVEGFVQRRHDGMKPVKLPDFVTHAVTVRPAHLPNHVLQSSFDEQDVVKVVHDDTRRTVPGLARAHQETASLLESVAILPLAVRRAPERSLDHFDQLHVVEAHGFVHTSDLRLRDHHGKRHQPFGSGTRNRRRLSIQGFLLCYEARALY